MCSSVCRRLLALGGHRVSHPERQAPAPGRPTWTVLSGRLRWDLPLSGALGWSSLFCLWIQPVVINRIRDEERTRLFFSRSSGSLANGWTLWSMTDCPWRTGSCCSSTLPRAMNSGVHSWRKLTPSRFDWRFPGRWIIQKGCEKSGSDVPLVMQRSCFAPGWTGPTRLCPEEAPRKASRTSRAVCPRCTSCAAPPEICLRSSAKPWTGALCWAAPSM